MALHASPAWAAHPWQQTGAAPVRTRCSGCPSRESGRARRESLVLKLDSLRFEMENRHLNAAEREHVSEEITRTVLALRRSLDESMRSELSVEALSPQAIPMPNAARAQVVYRNRGYLGVTFDGPSMDSNRPGEQVVRFLQYPRIALVEPGSPAERGGVLQGDTLLALNGTDVRENEISFTKLLIPDSKIVLRLRREGGSRDVKVTVAETPAYFTYRRLVPTPRASTAPDVPQGPARVRVLPPDGGVIVVPQPSQWTDGVAGAHMETITEGLGKALGTRDGVLVIRTMPGTPADRSGLEDGDIIVRAAGRPVVNVRALQRILAEAEGGDGVKLTIVREGKQREINLRW